MLTRHSGATFGIYVDEQEEAYWYHIEYSHCEYFKGLRIVIFTIRKNPESNNTPHKNPNINYY